MANIKNIKGQKFGRLVTLEYIKPSKWKCLCDCGNTKIVNRYELTRGDTKSCGCYRKEFTASLGSSKKLPNLGGTKRAVISGYKREDKTKGREWRFEEIREMELFEIMESLCHYCGTLPDNKRTIYDQPWVYNGLDRKNNEPWHDWDNCVACCKSCNGLKCESTYNGFLLSVKETVENYPYNSKLKLYKKYIII